MERYPMFRILSSGAVAAIATISVALPLQSQAVGVGGARPRDSIIVRMISPDGERGAARVDSIKTFLRMLDREGFGTPEYFAVTKRLDSLLLMRRGVNVMFQRSMNGEMPNGPRGWIGFNAQGPSYQVLDSTGLRITYFAYPSILSIDPESPAERAGIARGDMLIAYNGVDVVGHELNLTRLQIPDAKVTVTIRRDGEAKDYPITVAKTPVRVELRRQNFDAPMLFDMRTGIDQAAVVLQRDAMAAGMSRYDEHLMIPGAPGPRFSGEPGMPGPRFFIYSANGVFGASMVSVGPDLAKVLKLEKGMLVTEVAQESAAWKSGLRAGDVVVSVAGRAVTSLREVQETVRKNLSEPTMALQVMRDRKPQTFTVRLP